MVSGWDEEKRQKFTRDREAYLQELGISVRAYNSLANNFDHRNNWRQIPTDSAKGNIDFLLNWYKNLPFSEPLMHMGNGAITELNLATGTDRPLPYPIIKNPYVKKVKNA